MMVISASMFLFLKIAVLGVAPLLARVGDSNLNLHLPRLHPGAHSQHITNPEPLMEEIWLTNWQVVHPVLYRFFLHPR